MKTISRAQTCAARAAATLSAALSTGAALAHPGHDGHDGANGLLAGLLHPLTGADHLIALLSVGALFAAASLRARRAGFGVLLASLLAGAAFGIGGLPLPASEWMIALSVLLAGLLLIRSGGTRNGWLLAGTAVFALFHGYAHGLEAGGEAWRFVAGFLATSALLALAGYSLARALRSAPLPRQIAGAAASAAGVALLLRLAM